MPACAPKVTQSEGIVDSDGLREVRSKAFDSSFVRPSVDFGHYCNIIVSKSELTFITPDRSQQQFPLSEAQKNRFRQLLDANFADALGESTVVIELRDSQSEELLARVLDRGEIEGFAVAQAQGAPVTHWEDVAAVCERWAALVRKRRVQHMTPFSFACHSTKPG